MPSTATSRNRLEKQGSGENINSWGTKLNQTGLDLIDASLDGIESYTLSGSKTLTSTNYATDESRMRGQNITSGTGGTVTIPSVQKWYLVRNATSGDVVFTTGAGATATIATGQVTVVMCDGTNCYAISLNAYVIAAAASATAAAASAAAAAASATAAATAEANAETAETNAETAETNAEAARDAALAAQAAAEAASLPSQTGNSGKFLTTNGTAASWVAADDIYIRQAADFAMSNTAAVQKLFNATTNGALTLAVGVYGIEAGLYMTSFSQGTPYSLFDLKGAGTAVIGTGLLYSVSQGTFGTFDAHESTFDQGATVKIGKDAAVTSIQAFIRGTFVVTTAGTIIPSVAQNGASAPTNKAGSYCVVTPLGTGNTGGSWS